MAGYLAKLKSGELQKKLESGELTLEKVLADMLAEAERITGIAASREVTVGPARGVEPWATMCRSEELGRIVIKEYNELGRKVTDYFPELLLYYTGKLLKSLERGESDKEVLEALGQEIKGIKQLIEEVARLKDEAFASKVALSGQTAIL